MAEDIRKIVYYKGSPYYVIEDTGTLYRLENTTNKSITKLVEKQYAKTPEEFEEEQNNRPFGYINYTL